MDSQVKIRGIRIEPGEIQAALETLPTITSAAVRVVASPSGTKHLAAYFVSAGDHQVPVDELRRQLRERLPESMVPTYLVPMDVMPLTINGKVNFAALPDPEPATATSKYLGTPRSPTEDTIAAIYEEVLGLDRIQGQADFFELGGHSLLATQVISRQPDIRNQPFRACGFQSAHDRGSSTTRRSRSARSTRFCPATAETTERNTRCSAFLRSTKALVPGSASTRRASVQHAVRASLGRPA